MEQAKQKTEIMDNLITEEISTGVFPQHKHKYFEP